MRRTGWALAGAAAMLGVSAPANATCELTKVLELPVTMEGHVPTVPALVNGKPTSFEVDSGAFFSMLSPAAAAQFALKLKEAPDDYYISGVGGVQTNVSIANVKRFELGGAAIPNLDFLVAGNDFGTSGLLGQNLFGKFDMEYDLAHGAIRLFHNSGCEQSAIAYWAKTMPFSTVKIQSITRAEFHTQGDIKLDGATVTAMFDTGASTSMLDLQAAAKAGVRPDSPGVVDAGASWGVGGKRVRTWIGTFKSIKIGDTEEIRNIRIRFGDIDRGSAATMLLGADFFLSHRVMVDNTNHRLFLTYNGGPVFNLSIAPDKDDAPAVAQALAGPDPTDAGGWSRRGAGYLSRRDVARATEDFRQAVKLAPGEASYHRQLATALLAGKQRDAAMAELDAALAAKADDPDALLMRAGLRVTKDKPGALADADAFAAVAPRQSSDRVALGELYQRLHEPAKAVAAFGDWIAAHPGDVGMAGVLNNRCWVRALAGIELDQAMADCNRAVKLSGRDGGIVDSRAMVWFRKDDLAHARADYDAAIAADPKAAASLYMRGIVEKRAGDAAAADKDFAAARAIDKDVGDLYAEWGIKA